jgi:hypothetical protein
MDRRDSLKKGLLGAVATVLGPDELVKQISTRSGARLRPLTMRMSVPSEAIATEVGRSIHSSLQSIAINAPIRMVSEMKLESVPENDFYVTVTKLDKIYYHENERLITL